MNSSEKSAKYPQRLLICSLGSIGKKHLQVYQDCYPHIEIGILRSGCSTNLRERNEIVETFYDIDKALSWKPDAAIICTPATDHLTKSLQIAKSNIPMLIEKPIGTDLIETDLWKELERQSVILPILVGYVLRHDPCLKVVQNYIQNAAIGKIIEADFYCGSWLPDWRPKSDYKTCVSARRELGGGVLLELSHELDLAQLLLGSIELQSSIVQNSRLLDIDVEDQAILLGKSQLGVVTTIRLNFCSNPPRRSIRIRGSDGEISWNILLGKVQLVHKDGDKSECYESRCTANKRFEIQAKHFMSCVTNQCRPACTVTDGMKVLELVVKAREMSLPAEIKTYE